MRVGLGYDVHRFEKGLPLVLGGVIIPFDKGLKGHSDADVLLHSICDALLGAAALGDIGVLFPDSSEKFKGIDSRILLKETAVRIEKENYEIVNIDAVLILQEPKVMEYIPEMRKQISEILEIQYSQVSVKATTTEKLGYIGRGEGVAAESIVLINKIETG